MESFVLSSRLAALVSRLAGHVRLTDRTTLEAHAALSIAEDIRKEIQEDAQSIRPIAERILPGVNSIKDIQTIVIPRGSIRLNNAVERDNQNTACIIIPVVVSSQRIHLEVRDGAQVSMELIALSRGYIVASRCEIDAGRGEAVVLVIGIGVPTSS